MFLIGLSIPAHNFQFSRAHHMHVVICSSQSGFWSSQICGSQEKKLYDRKNSVNVQCIAASKSFIFRCEPLVPRLLFAACFLDLLIYASIFCVFTVLGPELLLKVNYQHCFDANPLAKCLGSVCIIIELSVCKFSCLMRP